MSNPIFQILSNLLCFSGAAHDETGVFEKVVFETRVLQSSGEGASAGSDPVIQSLMGVQFHTQLKCEESDEVIDEDTTAFSLKCNITLEVNHLNQGISQGLLDDREKHSAQLNRTAFFKVTLPSFLLLIDRLTPACCHGIIVSRHILK